MKIILCNQCGHKVITNPKLVSKGYFCYCPHCYEDKYQIETHIKTNSSRGLTPYDDLLTEKLALDLQREGLI